MKIPQINSIITGGRNAVRNVRNNYATSGIIRNAEDNLYMSLNGSAQRLKNSKFGKWVQKKADAISKALHLDVLKKHKDNLVTTIKEGFNSITGSGFGKKVKDFVTNGYKKITENETIKNGIDWVKNKYNEIAENPKVKRVTQSVKDFFSSKPKTV